MIRTANNGDEIEIDTYDNPLHLINIAKHLRIIWWNLLTIEEARVAINKEIYERQLSMEMCCQSYLDQLD